MSRALWWAWSVGLGGVAGSASAGYVAHIEGMDGAASAEVLAGETFGVRVRLDRMDPSAAFDAAVLRLVFDTPGLMLDPAWYEWQGPFVTAGLDDLSSPGPDDVLTVDSATYADPFDPEAVDLYFENLTPTAQATFDEGVLLTLSFRVPSDTPIGTVFGISAAPDTLSLGSSLVDADAGEGFVATVVIPAPASLAAIALAGILRCRRRR